MESIEAFPDGEWDCIRRIFANDLEEHKHDLFSQFPLLLDGDDELNIVTQPTFCAAPEAGENERMFYSLDAHHHNSNSSQYYISQESSSNCSGDDTVFIANPGSINYYFSYPDHVLANDACVYSMDEKNTIASFVPSNADIVMEECAKLCEDMRGDHILKNSECNQMEPVNVSPTNQLQLKRKLDVPPAEDKLNNGFQIHKKKPRVLKDGQGCMKTSWSNKNKKHDSKGEEAEETNATGSDGQSSSSNMSEDDNTSKSALNSNGKTRASRGSATDPQSLYARKRRERINERLRILQTLVPNGTKVDISTMLEEAVNYVKFLQLQIKLLSSDDLWMYAPLAYNGLDIGLNLNLKNFLPL